MKRLIIFIVFLGAAAGAYYYYDLSSARFKEEQETLIKQVEEKKALLEKELRGTVDATAGTSNEAEEKARKKKEVIDLLEKEKADGENAIRDRKKLLQENLKSNSEENRTDVRKQIEKYTTAIAGLRGRLEKVQQAEIVAKEKVVRSYEEKIRAIEAQITQVDKARLNREAKILAKSNVPDPEKYMIQRDANRKEAEAIIEKLRARIEKEKAAMDKAYEELNEAKHDFYKRDIVIANVRKIEEYEKARIAMVDQLGRMMAGRVTDADPEIAPLLIKQKEREKNLILMKEELKKLTVDSTRARTKAISADRSLADRVAAVSGTDAMEVLDKEIAQFRNIFFSICGVVFLVLMFMFIKAGNSMEDA